MNTLQEKRAAAAAASDNEVLAALEFALDEAVSYSGGVLTGFSVKIGESDVLMTLRAIHSGKPKICWVGCPDLKSCFRKAVVEGFHDGLQWQEDQFANGQG